MFCRRLERAVGFGQDFVGGNRQAKRALAKRDGALGGQSWWAGGGCSWVGLQPRKNTTSGPRSQLGALDRGIVEDRALARLDRVRCARRASLRKIGFWAPRVAERMERGCQGDLGHGSRHR